MSDFERNNLLRLVRMGILSPSFKEEEVEFTIVFAIWKEFRGACIHAEVESLKPPTLRCNSVQGLCELATCPIIRKALDLFERKRR
ncbi:MAG: hypothetical protein Q6362_003930 [Candidatus Wukongarchaeota archaeon]|nr:hypothetical protein [Candidatus Wukongarchaeota archaeon]MDO8128578.1 hypothetical protein [Candidatus Wukongarchaeota archaeon]